MATLSENIEQTIHDFDSIKDSIEQKGVSVPLGTPTSGYSEKISQIPTGIVPSGSVDITTNGEHDISEYATANVQVPQGVFPEGTIEITANGDHDVTSYVTASVNTPQPSGKIEITENGNDIDISQYATADVNVDYQRFLNSFIAGDMEYVTFEGELVPHYAFTFKKNLKEVYLPNATYIGAYAFFTEPGVCASAFDPEEQEAFDNFVLEKVVAPEVTNIENMAFIHIGDSVDYSLKEVITGTKLVSIGENAFTGRSGLKTFNFNEGLLVISSHAFSTSGIVYAKIPKTVEFVGHNAFKTSSLKVVDLTDFDINESETPWPNEISPNAFGGTSSLSPDFKIYFKNQETLDAYVNNNILSAYTDYFIVGTPPEITEDQNEEVVSE